jgi:PelA/Pel-15E family pectate lyase
VEKRVAAALATLIACAACKSSPAEAPRVARAVIPFGSQEHDVVADGGVRLALGSIDGNATHFFAAERLLPLPEAERAAWRTYLAHSAQSSEIDRATIEAELSALHRAAMTRAPFQKAFRVDAEMSDEWFHGEKAARIADHMLSFQTPSGGWSKHVDYEPSSRQPGQSYYSETDRWQYIATIDNDSTTEQLHFIARAYAARTEPRYRDSFLRGVEYLLQAQFPNGCWPQVYPLEGGYHDAVTYNDNAIVNVLNLLGEVAAGQFEFVPEPLRASVHGALERGTTCMIASQVVISGEPAVWAQQHDPLTLEPVAARTYELAALTGRESAAVVGYLMGLPSPDPRVMRAVHAAVAWFKAHEIFGYEYASYTLRKVDGAGPLWARLYEIGTARPIFSNRDGVKRYDWNELTDRRRGYVWYTKEPLDVLAQYEQWAKVHPR